MTDYSGLIQASQQRWNTAKFNSVLDAIAAAKRLVSPAAKSNYQHVSSVTTVPWWVIAVIHEREASQRWDANIAQGDRWDRKSTHVPVGRGPFKSWHDAAVDALTNCAPHAAQWKDWSAGGSLTLLELYNGLGYEDNHHMASPYLWAGTQHYVRGKYVADGQFDPHAVDHQLGCAILLKKMMELDNSITLGG